MRYRAALWLAPWLVAAACSSGERTDQHDECLDCEPACEPLDLSGPTRGSPALPACSGCECTSIGYVPLDALAGQTYQGLPGGLYCGTNLRPGAHEAAGLAAASAIAPLDAAGAPDPGGRYVFISVGMSNTTQEFSNFVPRAAARADKDPALVVVDGAQSGKTARLWADAAADVYTTLDARLAAASVTPAQVVVAWVKLANPSPTSAFPAAEQQLAADLRATLQNLKARYVNLRLAYLSSRIYAGYASTTLNPEPYAYQSAFAVKQVILEQITGGPELAWDPSGAAPVKAPWIAWGPYLWADGVNARNDGLSWACADLAQDGTHPSAAGAQKVATKLLEFVTTDTTARQWFLR